MSSTPRPLAVIVLAAGHGRRLGIDRPKVLAEIWGRPSIEYVLRAARELDPVSITVVVSERQGEVEKELTSNSGLDKRGLEFVAQTERLGTGHAARQAVDAGLASFDGDVLILYGDGPLVTGDLVRRLVEAHRGGQGARATMVTGVFENPTGYGRIVRDENGEFLRVIEEKDADEATRAITEVNTGIGCFRGETLQSDLEGLDANNEQKEYYLTDLFGNAKEGGHRVATVRAEDETDVLGFNSPEELARTREVMRQRIILRHLRAGVDIVAPDTLYLDDTVEIGAGTRLMPYCVMSGEVHIGKNCYVGPFANLRGGARLKDRAEIGNFVEVKNSVIGEGSKAKHLTYLGDTTIGKKSNIGAGTITANYDGKLKSPTVIGDGAFVGSGTVLVAPVKVGDGSYTGAGALVLKGRDVPDHTVVVGVPAKALRSTGDDKKKDGADKD